jgi:hypothetical protein
MADFVAEVAWRALYGLVILASESGIELLIAAVSLGRGGSWSVALVRSMRLTPMPRARQRAGRKGR